MGGGSAAVASSFSLTLWLAFSRAYLVKADSISSFTVVPLGAGLAAACAQGVVFLARR